MKTEETKQPIHTQGEWKFVHTNIHPEEKDEFHSVIQLPKFAISLINTNIISKEETEANTKRIVKCVNFFNNLPDEIKELERDIDTHDVLKEYTQRAEKVIRVNFLREILKQAEQE